MSIGFDVQVIIGLLVHLFVQMLASVASGQRRTALFSLSFRHDELVFPSSLLVYAPFFPLRTRHVVVLERGESGSLAKM